LFYAKTSRYKNFIIISSCAQRRDYERTFPGIFWPRLKPNISKFLNPGRDKTFSSFFKNAQTGAVPHPASYLTPVFYTGDKVAGA
jgi:hypothetical protein